MTQTPRYRIIVTYHGEITVPFPILDHHLNPDSRNTSSVIQPGLAPHKCQHRHFEFGFRYGLGDIEFFTLVVQQNNKSAQGYAVVAAYSKKSKWICVLGPEEGLQEHCFWRGTLKIEVD